MFSFFQLDLSGFRSFMSLGVHGRNDLGGRLLGGHIVFIQVFYYYSSYCCSDFVFVVFTGNEPWTKKVPNVTKVVGVVRYIKPMLALQSFRI